MSDHSFDENGSYIAAHADLKFSVVDCLMMNAGDSYDEGAALQNVTF